VFVFRNVIVLFELGFSSHLNKCCFVGLLLPLFLIMSNDRIRISFGGGYPWVNVNCSRIPHFRVGSSCPMPGMSVEIIALLTNYLNLTVDVTKVDSYHADYSYVFDELYNNEMDLFTMFFINTSTRAIKFDFTKELYLVCCFYKKTMIANVF
jgi:hypothetical protein